MSKESSVSLYKKAGVDIKKGDELVSWIQEGENPDKTIKNDAKRSLGSVIEGIGGFSGLFRPNFSGMKDPILVASSDGVGTKVLLGIDENQCTGLGIDLVAMCVNDLYTCGARPLFFLDYFATGQLNESLFKDVIKGIKLGLKQANTVLLGGETAELPGLYQKGHFDLAGFVVGAVDHERKLTSELVKHDDLLYGLASSGFHSNGYSLIRKWLNDQPDSLKDKYIDNLLAPTRIYHEIPELIESLPNHIIHGIAHITGGGISGNLKRILPRRFTAKLQRKSIPTPDWMHSFIEENHSSLEEVESIFNLGVGMIIAVDPSAAKLFEQRSRLMGLEPIEIGNIVENKNNDDSPSVEYI